VIGGSALDASHSLQCLVRGDVAKLKRDDSVLLLDRDVRPVRAYVD
jgi:hypothetical protein